MCERERTSAQAAVSARRRRARAVRTVGTVGAVAIETDADGLEEVPEQPHCWLAWCSGLTDAGVVPTGETMLYSGTDRRVYFSIRRLIDDPESYIIRPRVDVGGVAVSPDADRLEQVPDEPHRRLA